MYVLVTGNFLLLLMDTVIFRCLLRVMISMKLPGVTFLLNSPYY